MARGPDDRPFLSRITDPEMLVALSAVLIGVCALVVSVVQVRIMREEQHASVWPRVGVAQSYIQGKSLSVVVVNPGIGPAIIKSVSVSVDGQPRTSWSEVLNALVREDRSWNVGRSTISNRIIPAGEAVETVELFDSEAANQVYAELNRLNVEICYCSVYDRCWTVAADFSDGDPRSPQEVAACPVLQAGKFRD
jgi:hypothetical protein